MDSPIENQRSGTVRPTLSDQRRRRSATKNSGEIDPTARRDENRLSIGRTRRLRFESERMDKKIAFLRGKISRTAREMSAVAAASADVREETRSSVRLDQIARTTSERTDDQRTSTDDDDSPREMFASSGALFSSLFSHLEFLRLVSPSIRSRSFDRFRRIDSTARPDREDAERNRPFSSRRTLRSSERSL